MKIAIAGGTGFVGNALSNDLKEKGYTLFSPSRKEFWDLKGEDLEGTDVVINLVGESILGRWNKQKMEQIRSSRLKSTQFLCDKLLHLQKPPSLYLNASAIGYYGDRGEEILTEASRRGQGFLAEVCEQWETLPRQLSEKGIRVVYLRFGLILGSEGGALKLIQKPFQMGMGGTLGSGKQMMSWIALDDVVRGIEWVMTHPELSGPINFVSPEALTNAEFTQLLAQVLHKPAPLPLPKFVLSMIFGSGSEVFLASSRVFPEKLLKSGFAFLYSDLSDALKKYLILNDSRSTQ